MATSSKPKNCADHSDSNEDFNKKHRIFPPFFAGCERYSVESPAAYNENLFRVGYRMKKTLSTLRSTPDFLCWIHAYRQSDYPMEFNLKILEVRP